MIRSSTRSFLNAPTRTGGPRQSLLLPFRRVREVELLSVEASKRDQRKSEGKRMKGSLTRGRTPLSLICSDRGRSRWRSAFCRRSKVPSDRSRSSYPLACRSARGCDHRSFYRDSRAFGDERSFRNVIFAVKLEVRVLLVNWIQERVTVPLPPPDFEHRRRTHF